MTRGGRAESFWATCVTSDDLLVDRQPLGAETLNTNKTAKIKRNGQTARLDLAPISYSPKQPVEKMGQARLDCKNSAKPHASFEPVPFFNRPQHEAIMSHIE